MTILFDDTLTGHHQEYLSHLIRMADLEQDEDFILVAPAAAADTPLAAAVAARTNVTADYLSPDEVRRCKRRNLLAASWSKSHIVVGRVRHHHADRVVLVMLMEFMPLLLFMLPRGCSLSGIIYRIYLRNAAARGLRLWAEKVRFRIMSRKEKLKEAYVLNDAASATRLNSIYTTDKFKYLPDPAPNPDSASLIDMRERLGIPSSHTVFLHLGALTARKGSLEIMKALVSATEAQLAGKTFIFAGKMYDDIKGEFYTLLDASQQKCNIIVYDRFCSYELLYNLCYTCDVVLMPYSLTNISSGVLGYAATFHKPVIGPAQGLIGELIRTYSLGTTIPSVSHQNILHAICGLAPTTTANTYAAEHTAEMFINIISGHTD